MCRLCDAALGVDAPSPTDTDGNGYCDACYRGLRARPAAAAAAAPRFPCSVCGGAAPAPDLSPLHGRLVCQACLRPTPRPAPAAAAADQGAAPDDDPSAPWLKAPLPPNLLPRVTCPHCWHAFPPDQTLWVSQHADLLGDPVLGPEAQARFRPSRFNARGEALDLRDMPCQLLACPRCHLVVPRALLETEPLFVSIIGAPASGKSHFLAAMTWELRRVLSRRFGVAFNDADTLSNLALNGYEQTLFLADDPDRPVAIRKTELQGELYDQIRLGQQVISLPRPFVFTLRRAGAAPTPPAAAAATAGGNGSAPPPSASGRVRVLCLYDNAGEHFQPGMDSVASPGTQHLARSRVLLFLYDPTQHPRIRELCRRVSRDPQLHDAARTQRQETVLTEAAQRVRRYAGLSPHKKHNRPLVVIVAKADIWAPLFRLKLDREPVVDVPAGPAGAGAGAGTRPAVDVARVEQVSAWLRRVLLELTPEFVAAAEDFCREVIYVPCSALGSGPRIQQDSGLLAVAPKDVRPRWVTVPLLYGLAKWANGLIPAAPAAPAPAASTVRTPTAARAPAPPVAGGGPEQRSAQNGPGGESNEVAAAAAASPRPLPDGPAGSGTGAGDPGGQGLKSTVQGDPLI